MPLTPAPGFTTALITATGISIYAALLALDPNENWPKSARAVQMIVTGVVTLSDGTHAVATNLPAATLLTFTTSGYSDVYLDNMIVAGGGTLALYIST